MAENRTNLGITTRTVVVVALATPATLALSMFAATGDARWRPLAQTWENTMQFVFASAPLEVAIAWPEGRPQSGADAMSDYIRKAIKARGITARITVTRTTGPGSVTYLVGPNHIGPYPLTKAVDGINGAVSAYWRQSGTSEARDAI